MAILHAEQLQTELRERILHAEHPLQKTGTKIHHPRAQGTFGSAKMQTD